MEQIAVLFARQDSIYKTLPGCDVWDASRDARQWPGGNSIIAHPPCRAWGRLKHFAHPRDDEKDLARFAVKQIRRWGGVLEHPARSELWSDQGLPEPTQGIDAFGGWTFSAPQWWWGHPADKATWLYIVGAKPRDLPAVTLRLGEAEFVVASGSLARGRALSQGGKKGITKANREHTPPQFALWLLEVARRCHR